MSYPIEVHTCDGDILQTDISSITLMFFDTVVAELSYKCGTFEHFEYEDEDGDHIAIRSDEDMPSFKAFLEQEQMAIIWLVKSSPMILDDIPAIIPSDLKHLNLISQGQFGSVYRSIHIPSDRVLAVKCVSLDNYGMQRDSAISELALIKKCSSCAYITDLLGAYMDSQMLYICLEYMDGGAVGNYEPISAGVLMYLSDFGLSKVMEHSITRTYVGTTIYMAPERLRGGVYRIESDIWSFGLSLWELALGHYPLQTPKDTLLTTTISCGNDRQTHVENIIGHSQELCALINGCLQQDVQLRWNVSDLTRSDYIKEAYPIDHNVIKEFIIKNMNS
uniref:mitogen-activated protein kinase kinase n=1 Tax=Haemonchus contortus TaxID=6289 RepID=A0A7I4Y0D3_HAECO